MELNITGKQIDIGDSLRNHVQSRVTQSVGRYFDRPVNGSVTFSRDGHEYRTDCTIHLASGLHLHSQGRSIDIYASFDGAIERMDKRAQRHKGRLKDHHSAARAAFAQSPAREQVFSGDHSNGGSDAGVYSPLIISEGITQLNKLSVGEAVMQLDLMEAPALVFQNAAHGGLNVVYRRSDGNIGWIDPQTDSGKR
ncbi:MAG: ribosome-associated translation inhibitor RaiA [Micropepsaceae bacterium]